MNSSSKNCYEQVKMSLRRELRGDCETLLEEMESDPVPFTDYELRNIDNLLDTLSRIKEAQKALLWEANVLRPIQSSKTVTKSKKGK